MGHIHGRPRDTAETAPRNSACVQPICADESADFTLDSEVVEIPAAVGRLIKAGMKEVNYRDAIMRNKYTRNPDKLRAWNSASHIERAPQREKKPAPAAGGANPAIAKSPGT